MALGIGSVVRMTRGGMEPDELRAMAGIDLSFTPVAIALLLTSTMICAAQATGNAPNSTNGTTLSAEQWQSPAGTGNNGIKMSLAQCALHAYACSVVAPALYSQSEAQPWGGANILMSTSQVVGPMNSDPLGCVTDWRWGAPQVICNQGMSNQFGGSPTRFLGSSPTFAQNITKVGNGVSSWTPSALFLKTTVFSGGRDSYWDEAYQVNQLSLMTSHTLGTIYDRLARINHYSPGDTIGIYSDSYGVGSSVGANEGITWHSHNGESGNVVQAKIYSVSCSATCTFNTHQTNGVAGSFGDGVALIDLSQAYTTGYVANIARGVITGSGSTNWDAQFGVTTWTTTTTASIDDASTGANSFPRSDVTIPVASSKGFAVNQIVCIFRFGDTKWGCSHITAIPTGTSITVDQLNYPTHAGSTLASGGLTGYGFSFDADTVTPENLNGLGLATDSGLNGPIRVVFPIVSNSRGNILTLYTPQANIGGLTGTRAQPQMGGSGATASVIVSGGVISACTITNGGSGYIYGPWGTGVPQIRISGITHTTAPIVTPTAVKQGSLSGCTIVNPGAGISGNPTVTVVTSNPYHIFPQAMTLDAYNHDTGAIDGSAIKTTPYVGTFSSGDLVEQPHYFNFKQFGLNMIFNQFQPGGQHFNMVFKTGGSFVGNDYEAAFYNINDPTVYNGLPPGLAEYYIPGRGLQTTPHGFTLFGPHQAGLQVVFPTFGANGGSKQGSVFQGCGTAAQCALWNRTIQILTVANSNVVGPTPAEDVLGYNPTTQTWTLTAGATGFAGYASHCTYTFGPSGFSSSGPGCSSSSPAPPTSSAVEPYLSGTTGSIGGSALNAGACSSGTVRIPAATASMAVVVAPVSYPGDGIFWHGYVSTAGTVTVKVCASVAAVPTASAYNVRVIR